MKVKEVRRLMSDVRRQEEEGRCVKTKETMKKVIQSPEKKIVCTIDINIKIEILNEGYK